MSMQTEMNEGIRELTIEEMDAVNGGAGAIVAIGVGIGLAVWVGLRLGLQWQRLATAWHGQK